MQIRRKYFGLVMDPIGFEPENSVLAGSKTDKHIIVDEVTVQGYAPGFSDGGNDFKDISFD